MKQKSFGLGVPVGKRHDPRLARALSSIAIQELPVEIAVCSCSEDSLTKQAVDQYGDLVSYVRFGPDEGQAAAIMEAWTNLENEYLGWLNADDYLLPGVLKEVATAFEENPEVDIVYGQSLIETDTEEKHFLHPEVQDMSSILLRSNIISQPSCFVRKTAIDAVGGLNTDLHYTMDWDLWVRLFENECLFHFINRPLSVVYWGGNTKTGTLTVQRARELWSIVRRNNGLKNSLSTMIGFARSHIDTAKYR